MGEMQFAYGENHSTETSSHKSQVWHPEFNVQQRAYMFNPIRSLNSFLTLWTTPYSFNIFTQTFGIRNKALNWVEFYLNERSQKVAIGNIGTNSGATSKISGSDFWGTSR